MMFQSSSVSFVSPFRMLSGKMNFPMSCSRPAVWTRSCSSSESPAAIAISRE